MADEKDTKAEEAADEEASSTEKADASVEAKPTKAEAASEKDAAPAPPEDLGPEPPMEIDSPKMSVITTAYVVIAALVIVLVLGTREYFLQVFDSEHRAKIESPVSSQLLALRNKEQARLTKYQWVDKEKGVVRIPIDKAKELVLAKYQAMAPYAPEPVVVEAPKPAEVKHALPDGVTVVSPPGSLEDQLVQFIQDGERKVDKDTWYNFDRVVFDTGKSALLPDSDVQLQNLVAILKAFPEVEIKVGGYTDNQGDKEANKKLSTDRAEAVVKRLVELGIDKARIKSEGYGDKNPVASNDTEEGRAQNRRMALRVTKKPEAKDAGGFEGGPNEALPDPNGVPGGQVNGVPGGGPPPPPPPQPTAPPQPTVPPQPTGPATVAPIPPQPVPPG